MTELAIPISHTDAQRQSILVELRDLWHYRNLTYHLVKRNVTSRYKRSILGAGWTLLDRLIHFSTNYVFDGTKGAPCVETDAPGPINTYGRTKLEGEQAIQAVGGAYLILRTGWVYCLHRECFVTKVLRWVRMLAEATALLIAKAQGEVST